MDAISKLKLDGRVAIVTGAAGTIGSATARLLASRGAAVVAVDRPGTDWNGLGLDCDRIDADVTSEDDVRTYVDRTVEQHGRIDILFNNAGIEGPVTPIDSYALEDFLRVQAVNVTGCFLGLKYVLPVMYRQKSGSIINTSSTAGLRGGAGMIGYSASKHAVTGMTKVAGCEAAPHGVRVNAVNPGPIDGRMMDSIGSGMGEAVRAAVIAGLPAHRYGLADEVAEMVAFLASDAGSYSFGSCFSVDGGYIAV